ncbi:MAG: hypothetical protein JWO03_3138 [Bacteroidetes bacterium]|nr:hypothetical protein [Bacteroidota bacterium]
MRYTIFVIAFITASGCAIAQSNAPTYTVVNDSATHTTVLHKSIDEIIKVRNAYGQQGIFEMIIPDIKIKNGIVDHKGPTGNLDVREYYSNNKLIGYIQYDGSSKEREIFYNAKGDITLEKRYDKGAEVYKNDSVRKPSVLLIPVKINHDNSSR